MHDRTMLCQMCGEELAQIVSDYRGEPSISSVITEYLLSLLPSMLLIWIYPVSSILLIFFCHSELV